MRFQRVPRGVCAMCMLQGPSKTRVCVCMGLTPQMVISAGPAGTIEAVGKKSKKKELKESKRHRGGGGDSFREFRGEFSFSLRGSSKTFFILFCQSGNGKLTAQIHEQTHITSTSYLPPFLSFSLSLSLSVWPCSFIHYAAAGQLDATPPISTRVIAAH